MQSAARPDDLPPASEEGLELLDDGSAAQHQASPLPLWATRGCGLVLMLLLAANFIAAVVIWATPHPTRGTGVPVHRVSVQAQTNHSPATVVSSESYDESYDYPHDPHSARACVYDNGSPLRSLVAGHQGALPRAARARSIEKKANRMAARKAPTAEEAHRMHAGKSSSHALQKTRCAQHVPAGMLQGLPIAAERRAVGWGNGEGAGEGVATSTAAFPWRRARASGEERLVPTPSRILSHISRLTVAVLAANLVRWRARLAVGRV